MSRINFILWVEPGSQVERREIQTKKGKMLVNNQECLIMFDFYKSHVLQPFKLNLKPESEQLTEGYYVLSVDVGLDKYDKPQIMPFSPYRVYPLGETLPSNLREVHDVVSSLPPHKSVSSEMIFKEESQQSTEQLVALLTSALGNKQNDRRSAQ